MRFEVLSLGSNVIRFPIELRAKPSLDLLIDIAPDSREIALVAEAFGLPEPDPEGRDKADRAMAETIARTALPPDPGARRAALDALLKPFVERAVAVCAESRQAALRSDEAGEKVANAQIEGGYWLEPLEAIANSRAIKAAERQIAAYVASQAAQGATGAFAFANRGEPWRPLVLHEEAEALFFGAAYASPSGTRSARGLQTTRRVGERSATADSKAHVGKVPSPTGGSQTMS